MGTTKVQKIFNPYSPGKTMEKQISNVYTFKNHTDAEMAVKSLGLAGFEMRHLSIVGRGYHTEEHPIGFYTKGDRIRSWGKFGLFWGAIWGLLFSPAVFVLPSVGVVAMAGPLGTALAGALEGAVVVGGFSALARAMLELGVDTDHAIRSEVAIKADHFLLLVHGSHQEIEQAHNVLQSPMKQLAWDQSSHVMPS